MNDPFAAIPRIAPHVRVRTGADGLVQIKRTPPEGRGLRGFLARHLGLRRTTRIDLDERGSFFWSRIDGVRNLRAIEGELRARFELGDQESKDAVILFTKMLMRRALILLDLRPSHKPANHPS
jgi:hypothetical protein